MQMPINVAYTLDIKQNGYIQLKRTAMEELRIERQLLEELLY